MTNGEKLGLDKLLDKEGFCFFKKTEKRNLKSVPSKDFLETGRSFVSNEIIRYFVCFNSGKHTNIDRMNNILENFTRKIPIGYSINKFSYEPDLNSIIYGRIIISQLSSDDVFNRRREMIRNNLDREIEFDILDWIEMFFYPTTSLLINAYQGKSNDKYIQNIEVLKTKYGLTFDKIPTVIVPKLRIVK